MNINELRYLTQNHENSHAGFYIMILRAWLMGADLPPCRPKQLSK